MARVELEDLVQFYIDIPAGRNRTGHPPVGPRQTTQAGHIMEMASSDWLTPNARSPKRADSAAWIAEVLDEPHTREVLDGLLEATSDKRQT